MDLGLLFPITNSEREEIKLCSFAEDFKQPDELSPQSKTQKQREAKPNQAKPSRHSVKGGAEITSVPAV